MEPLSLDREWWKEKAWVWTARRALSSSSSIRRDAYGEKAAVRLEVVLKSSYCKAAYVSEFTVQL